MKAEGPERRADRADAPTVPSADIPAVHEHVVVKAVSELGYYVGRGEPHTTDPPRRVVT